MVREGYKKTEVGEIPEDWEVKSLEEVVNQQRGITYGVLKPEKYKENGIPMIRIVNMKNNSISTSNIHLISKNLSNQYSRTILKGNEILISLVGTVGNVAYVNDNLIGYNVHRNIGVIPVLKNISPLFIMYYLISEEGKRQIKLKTTGGNQPLLNLGDLNKITVALPPLKEQEKIAEILSTLDCQIDDTDKLIEKTKELKKGLMQKLLIKGIAHKEFKKTEVGEIPVEWEVKTIKEGVDLINGKAFKPSEWKGDGKPIIRIQNLNGSDEYNYFDGLIEEKYKVTKGQLLFSWSGSKGTSFGPHLWKGINGVLNQHIFKVNIKEKDKIDTGFMYYNLKNVTTKIENEAHGSAGLVHVTKGTLEKIKIPMPKIEEQQKITNILASVDSQVEEYENKKSKLEELKKGLMQQLLTGKIRTV